MKNVYPIRWWNNPRKSIHVSLSTGKKQLTSRLNLTYSYIDDVFSINNSEFENYLGQMCPAELESKETTESITSASYLDLLLSIGRMVNFTLPFTTNKMISISTSQTFRSWVVVFHLRRPMAFLSVSFYDTPGFAPCIIFFQRIKRFSSKQLKQGFLVDSWK